MNRMNCILETVKYVISPEVSGLSIVPVPSLSK